MKKVFLSILCIVLLVEILQAQNWSTEIIFPGNRAAKRLAGVSAVVDNNLYFGLGLSPFSPLTILKDFWKYNSTTKIWTQMPDFPGSARYDAVSFVIGTNIYVGTGDVTLKDAELNTGSYTRDVFIFNTLNNTWSPTTDLPISIGEAIGFTINGKGYITGGKDSNGAFHKDLYCYDPDNLTWTRKADFPGNGRSYPIGFSANGKGYVGGGYTGSWVLCCGVAPTLFNDFWQYDPNTDSWITKGNTFNGGNDGSGNIAQAVCISTCDRGYIVSGRVTNSFTPPSNTTVSEYNPDTNSWSLRASLPSSLEQGSGWYISGRLFAGLGINASIYSLNLYPLNATQLPICTTSGFTVTNPSGSTVTWLSSNSSGLSINPTTGAASRVNNFNGQIIISALITGTCGNIALNETVIVGTPPPTGITGPSYNLCYQKGLAHSGGNYSVVSPVAGVQYSWQIVDSNNEVFDTGDGTTITVYGSQLGVGVFKIKVRSTTPCGTSAWVQKNLYVVNCSGASLMSVYPNPTSNEVTVELSSESEVFSADLIDSQGECRKMAQSNCGKITINTSDLERGRYFLHVTTETGTEKKQILIER